MKYHEMNRRDMTRMALVGVATAALSPMGVRKVHAAVPDKPRVKIAGYAYDRVRAIQDGRLDLDSCDVSFHAEDIYGLNQQVFGATPKYEVSEIGLIPYITRYANEDFRAYTLIPVFISRIFRHRNIFVRTDRGIDKPEDLRGKRVGTPGYGMSACTWIRGFLQDVHGVKPEDMHWIETTKSSDGGKVNGALGNYFLPDDFPLKKGPNGVDESEMIIAGDVDALITAITPKAFLDRHPKVKRLFPDFRAAEQEYYRKTRVFPIMHVIAVRRDFVNANPGLPKALYSMYSQAKQAAYDDLETTTALKVTLPWATQEFLDTQKLMGDNYWPYGVKANRKELELVMRYTHEQGLAKRRLRVEEVFHPATLELSDA
jgi:4,5-dihydroxyphthalate decarboxylase